MTIFKTPISVLVVIHTPDHRVLLLERAAHPGFWQSVTGSLEAGEMPAETARREVAEETGIADPSLPLLDWQQTHTFEIFEQWRHRYAPGVSHNTEHVFSLCVPHAVTPRLSPEEHRAFEWLELTEAAERCFSWSNRATILALPEKTR